MQNPWSNLVCLVTPLCFAVDIAHCQGNAAQKRWPEQVVSFTSEAGPAGKLIPALGRAAGIPLECAGDLSAEVLFLHVGKRPLSDVMKKLAESTVAEWEQTARGYRFFRSTALVDKLRTEQLDSDEAAMGHVLKPLFDGTRAVLTPDNACTFIRERVRVRGLPINEAEALNDKFMEERETRLRSHDAMNPSMRFIARIVKMIGIRPIVAMRPGTRLVYATRPTAMQRGLEPRAISIAATFLREDATWMEARRKVAAEKDDSKVENGSDAEYQPADDQDEWCPRFGDNGSAWRDRRLGPDAESQPSEPIRVMMILECNSTGIVGFQLLVLNTNFAKVVNLHSDDMLRTFLWSSQGSHIDEPLSKRKVKVAPALAGISKAYETIKPNVDSGKHFDADSSSASLLTRPTQHDPLALSPGSILASISTDFDLDIAASLHDECYRIAGWGKDTSTTFGDVVEQLEGFDRARVSVANGWMTVTPTRPLDQMDTRIDRSALEMYLRRTAVERKFSIDDLATYLASTSEQAPNDVITGPTWILTSGQYPSSSGNDWLLRLYGALSQSQRARVLAGGQVNFGEMTPRQRAIARRTVYGPHMNYGASGNPGSRYLGELSDEPTEIAPRGLVPDAGIRAKRIDGRRVYIIDPALVRNGGIYGVIDPGSIPWGRSGPGPLIPAGGFDSLEFEIRPIQELMVEVDILPGYSLHTTYHEEPLPAAKRYKSVAELPADIRPAVEREMESIRQLAERK